MLSHLRPLRLASVVLLFLYSLIPSDAQIAGVPALASPLRLPRGLAYTPSGDLVFTEQANHMIRRLTGGTLITMGGSGMQGFGGDKGPATQATFDSPEAVVCDAQGALYVADAGNHRVRRIDGGTGIVTTVAGTGAATFSGDGGPAATASLVHPVGLALDAGGNLFIADIGAERVRRIDAQTGIISTVAGNGIEGFAGDGDLAVSAALDEPRGLALDAGGNLFIADTGNHRVRMVDSVHGKIQTVVGGPGSSLSAPNALATDSTGALVIVDGAGERVLRFNPQTGTLSALAGSGTQAFLGDGSAAVLATLNSPSGLAIAPDGSIAIADTGNGRVRRISTSGVGPALIQTVAGLGILPSTVLTLSGASVTSYGSGTLAAGIAGGDSAQGSLTLLDLTNASTPVATASLSGGFASFSTSTLAAGVHRLVATYSGDTTHQPATSGTWTLTVDPLPVTAKPAPASMLFGQTIPPLLGSLSGVLARDVAGIQAVFTTAAASGSAPGAYPISATLSGSAAGNYTLGVAPVSLIITKAPSITNLPASGGSTPQTVSVQVASTTTGVPTGAVSLLEGGATLASGNLNAVGLSTFSTGAFSTGQHHLIAAYGGDMNFTASSSPAVTLTVAGATPQPQPDFSLTPSVAGTVSLSSGNATAIGFTITNTNGAMPGPIALSVSGLPPFTSAAFNPPSIPPGGIVSSFTLTIAPTGSAQARSTRDPLPAICALLLPFLLRRRRSATSQTLLSCLVLAAALVPIAGCGDRVNQGATGASTTPVLYMITVTGTATAADGTLLQHSAAVQLTVTP